eukprot:7870562-Pyramimonas_sp.AAC.1
MSSRTVRIELLNSARLLLASSSGCLAFGGGAAGSGIPATNGTMAAAAGAGAPTPSAAAAGAAAAAPPPSPSAGSSAPGP